MAFLFVAILLLFFVLLLLIALLGFAYGRSGQVRKRGSSGAAVAAMLAEDRAE